ncbi:hypothetical protein L3i20_v248400 [Paenibacillus sp. L3-i20]|nr:hypothetical protein L3i20_v248400 [Paenibacillus sp. L3-i20]
MHLDREAGVWHTHRLTQCFKFIQHLEPRFQTAHLYKQTAHLYMALNYETIIIRKYIHAKAYNIGVHFDSLRRD